MKKYIAILLLVFPFLISCDGVSPLAPIGSAISIVVRWVDGEAHRYYRADYTTVQRASKRVIKDLGFPIIKEEPGPTQHTITTKANNKFKIKIKYVEKNITLVSIRVNFMGDKDYAELFYKSLDKNITVVEYDGAGNPKKVSKP